MKSCKRCKGATFIRHTLLQDGDIAAQILLECLGCGMRVMWVESTGETSVCKNGPGVDPIVSTPDVCGGEPRIRWSRISVRHIWLLHAKLKMTASDIAAQYPHLTGGDVEAAIAYAIKHPELQPELQKDDDE